MNIRFVTPLTVKPYELRKLLRLWDESGDPRNPFARVLVTPLFASQIAVRLIREELKEKRGSEITFDSGGYYVQQGRLAYDALYGLLLEYYNNNQWADWYVLPDHVPTSRDDIVTVEHKVRDTVTIARLFHSEMPTPLQPRAFPVIQGHTIDQIQWCMESYASLGVKRIGFGSFSTTGAKNSINFLSERAENTVRRISHWAQEQGLAFHLFGISGPDLFAFRDLAIDTCDSMNWYKAANYGKVFFPFVRAYSLTNGSMQLRGISEEQFWYLRQLTEHDCPFCRSFRDLSESYWSRRLHNLACVLDAIDMLNGCEEDRIRRIFNSALVEKSVFRQKYGGN